MGVTTGCNNVGAGYNIVGGGSMSVDSRFIICQQPVNPYQSNNGQRYDF